MIDLIGTLRRIFDEVVAARVAAVLVHEDLHACQFIYPILAVPVTMVASGVAWTYGVLTQIVPINIIASDFTIHEITISAMSANASFVGQITYGAGDAMWSNFAVTRGGVQSQSLVMPVQGCVIPANSVIKCKIADSIGTSTLALKIAYHLEP